MPAPRSPQARRYLPWYSTKAWQSIRLHQLSHHPLCAMCEQEGRITPATVCDHIVPHKGDWHKFINGPFQSLCSPCHNRHKQSEDRTGKAKAVTGLDGWPIEAKPALGETSHPAWFSPLMVPLTIVCGPPASGKTTYVARHKGERDIVFDLDAIAMKRFGKPAAMLPSDHRLACLTTRNQRLAELMRPAAQGKYNMAWLILSEASADRRQWWQDKLKPSAILIIETPPDECVARAKADTNQQRPADTATRIADWWQTYTRRRGEIVINSARHAETA